MGPLHATLSIKKRKLGVIISRGIFLLFYYLDECCKMLEQPLHLYIILMN